MMERKIVHKAALLVMFFLCLTGISTERVHAEEIELQEMHVQESDYSEIWDGPIVDSYGNEYSDNIIYLDASNFGYVSYDLNGQYESFSGTVVPSDETGTGADMSLAMFADGELVYSRTNITRQTGAEDFQINVSNVGKLEIKASNDGEYSCGWVFIVNGTGVKAETSMVYPEYSALRDTFEIDSRELETGVSLMRDSYGELHNGFLRFATADGGYALYNLNQKFVTFNASIVTGSDTSSEAEMSVDIYLDDQLAFSQNGITRQSGRIDISLDVTDKKVMKILTASKDWDWDHYVYLVDDILMPHVHTPGDWKVISEPSCTENGEKVQYCEECGEECNWGIVEATGHKPTGDFVEEKEASCDAEGLMVQKCEICGKICEKKTVPKLEHKVEENWSVVTEADCQNEGEKVKRCQICGEICEKENIKKIDHIPESEWVVIEEANCQSEGKEVIKCQNCGEILETRIIEKKEHTPSRTEVELISSSCTDSGTGAIYCEVCGTLLENTVIPVKGHSFGKWTTVSGSIWNAPIVKERICSVCLYRESQKSYAWIWVKPLLILVIVAGALAGIWYILCKRQGVKPQKENIKTVIDVEMKTIKGKLEQHKEKRSNDDVDDILNRHDK